MADPTFHPKCPQCGGETRVNRASPGSRRYLRHGPNLRRICVLCGFYGLFTSQANGGLFIRRVYSADEANVMNMKYGPECQFVGCPKMRKIGGPWCVGHAKQRFRQGVAGMKPLNLALSAAMLTGRRWR